MRSVVTQKSESSSEWSCPEATQQHRADDHREGGRQHDLSSGHAFFGQTQCEHRRNRCGHDAPWRRGRQKDSLSASQADANRRSRHRNWPHDHDQDDEEENAPPLQKNRILERHPDRRPR